MFHLSTKCCENRSSSFCIILITNTDENNNLLGRGNKCLSCWLKFYNDGLLKRGTGITGLMRGMATLPQGNQELLVVREKVGRPPGELGVSKSMECDIFPSAL